MRIIDISRTLSPRIAVWPGDTPFRRQSDLTRTSGAAVNLSTLIMSAHTGTHIDAPSHITDAPVAVEQLDLAAYWGLAQVVTVHKADGPLVPCDFAEYDLSAAPRLLVRSSASGLPPDRLPDSYVYPSPELAAHLGSLHLRLYGTDAPSVDASDSQTLPGHNALLRNGIAILEGLDLSAAADGLYELVALPLKIEGGDGSPVRAALRVR